MCICSFYLGENLEWPVTVNIHNKLACGIRAFAQEELVVEDIKPDNMLT